MASEWESFLKVSGWTSEYESASKLLRYLKNKRTGSEASRKIYGYTLFGFCRHTDKTPEELVSLGKREIENLMEDFGYEKKENGCSSRTTNTLLCNLKTFFKVNGFRDERELDIELFYQPVRARTRQEYVPTLEEALKMAEVAGSLRDQAIILVMVSSGLRNSTLRAIRYSDVREELERGEAIVLIRVYREMKQLVPSACKGDIEYFTFVSKKAVDAMRLYLKDKVETIGRIRDEDPLFSSEHNQLSQEGRIKRPLSDRQLQSIVKQAARRAGIKDWRIVTPHCLRKTYETLLRSQLKDGTRIDMQTQIYLMGHTLPGGLGPYYDAKIEDMRKEYSKLIFTLNDEKLTKAIGAFKAAGELLRTYTALLPKGAQTLNPDRISKAVEDFMDEIQQEDGTHERSRSDLRPVQPDEVSNSEGSHQTVGQVPFVGSDVPPSRGDVCTEKSSPRETKGLTKTDAESTKKLKQVDLDSFFDSPAEQD